MWDTWVVRRVRAIVSGRVQGVSYRASTADEAQRLGLAGWVQNRVDGRVELEAEGPPERVTELLRWCEHGPPAARVSGVAVEELAPVAGEAGFTIRRTD
jgi:acylphosphatase